MSIIEAYPIVMLKPEQQLQHQHQHQQQQQQQQSSQEQSIAQLLLQHNHVTPTTTTTTTTNSIIRPTEAQLRWVQFHLKKQNAIVVDVRSQQEEKEGEEDGDEGMKILSQQEERIRRFYLTPLSKQQVPNALPIDLKQLSDNHNNESDTTGRTANDNKLKKEIELSQGRQLLLIVSQRQYEERKQQIDLEGYEFDVLLMNDEENDNFNNNNNNNNNDEKKVEWNENSGEVEEDVIDCIFDGTNTSNSSRVQKQIGMYSTRKQQQQQRSRRRRRRSHRYHHGNNNNLDEDIERIRRFEAAFYALLSTLVAIEESKQEQEQRLLSLRQQSRNSSMKRWNRPIDFERNTNVHHQGPTTTAPQFTETVRTQLHDVARQYLNHQQQEPHQEQQLPSNDHRSTFSAAADEKVPNRSDPYDDDNNNENENENDDIISFVECFEKHITDHNYFQTIDAQSLMKQTSSSLSSATSRDIVSSFVAKYEQQQHRFSSTNLVPAVQVVTNNITETDLSTTTTTTSATIRDMIQQWNDQNKLDRCSDDYRNQTDEKDGLVQRMVLDIEQILQQHTGTTTSILNAFILIDGKLHKPLFAQLIQQYLLSVMKSSSSSLSLSSLSDALKKNTSRTTAGKMLSSLSSSSPLSRTITNTAASTKQPSFYSTYNIPSEETNSVTQNDDEKEEEKEMIADGIINDEFYHQQQYVTRFVQTLMDQLDRDDSDPVADKRMILTEDGMINRTVLENILGRCVNEVSKGVIESDIAVAAVHNQQQQQEAGIAALDRMSTPVFSTTSLDVFDQIRSVNVVQEQQQAKHLCNLDNTDATASYNEHRPSTVNNVSHGDQNRTSTSKNNIVSTVSNKVSELFKSLNMKGTTEDDDVDAYMAFREYQVHKQRSSIDPPTTDDISSQSSYRVLPRGIRNVVKGIRLGMAQRNQQRTLVDPKLELETSTDADDETMFDDVESKMDSRVGTNDNLDLQQSALLRYGVSESMDTDGSTISGSGQQQINRMSALAGITLSPTLLTKRHQQAIRAVESYNWAQVKYLLSANPWLAEMADVNTNQYVLHKVAYYGSGQLGIDHGTGEVISVRHPPIPDQINHDLINLFPSSVHKLDHDGNLPLHMAALSANLPMIHLLGTKFSSAASVRNEDGMLPLHLALIACASPVAVTIGSKVEPVDVIQALLRLFPGAIGVTDNEGNLPIHTAASVLRGSQGAAIISLLLNETEAQVTGPAHLRFRTKQTVDQMYDDTMETKTEISLAESSIHDDNVNCLLVSNDIGYTPLQIAIYAHAGWEVIKSLICDQSNLYNMDFENNTALHLLVGELYNDPKAALIVLRAQPETASVRNSNGMLPIEIACMQMLPREVILGLVLVDLPINLDGIDSAYINEGHGASWWYLVCECDDYYVSIVQEVVSMCSFPQIRSLCLMKNGSGDVVLSRATPKCRNVLDRVLRIIGRFEFVDSAPIYSDAASGVDAFNALDFGSDDDQIVKGKSVILKCFTSELSFLAETSILKDLKLSISHFEEIIIFSVGTGDSNRGPLPDDGIRRYFVSIENPKLTLGSVVRGMLNNRGCQTDQKVRHRYSVKVFSVLRSIALSLQQLHSQGYIHGNLSLESCGKFDETWKLTNLLDATKIGEIVCYNDRHIMAPPEAVQESNVAFDKEFRAKSSVDVWAFGKVAYETLTGKSLLTMELGNKLNHSSMDLLAKWNDTNVLGIGRDLELIGIPELGIGLITSCLLRHERDRPTSTELVKHSIWTNYNRFSPMMT